MMTKLSVWAFLVSIGHVTLIKERRLVAETWLITQNLKPGKEYVIDKLTSSSSRENGNIVISKDDCEKLSRDHKHVLVLDFLDHVTLSADCYCGTLSLQQSFFAKGLGHFAKVLSFCMQMPGVIHPTRQLFMAINLIGYGSVPILRRCFISH
jgi:hypothetical protein